MTRPSRHRLQLGMFVVLALAVVLLTVGATLLALRVHAAERADARRHAAVHAARQQATDLTSLSYRTLDADIDRVLDGATGRFAAQFAGHTKQLQTLMPKVKAVTEGKVLSAGVVESGADSATVLLAVDQTVVNETRPSPAGGAANAAGSGSGAGNGQAGKRPSARAPAARAGGVVRHYRMAMTLTPGQGRWLVSELRFVS